MGWECRSVVECVLSMLIHAGSLIQTLALKGKKKRKEWCAIVCTKMFTVWKADLRFTLDSQRSQQATNSATPKLLRTTGLEKKVGSPVCSAAAQRYGNVKTWAWWRKNINPWKEKLATLHYSRLCTVLVLCNNICFCAMTICHPSWISFLLSSLHVLK